MCSLRPHSHGPGWHVHASGGRVEEGPGERGIDGWRLPWGQEEEVPFTGRGVHDGTGQAEGWSRAEMVAPSTKVCCSFRCVSLWLRSSCSAESSELFPSWWNSLPSLLCTWKGQVTSSCRCSVRRHVKGDFGMSLLRSTCPFCPPLPSALRGEGSEAQRRGPRHFFTPWALSAIWQS